jgi:hypothetical protein
MIFTCAPCRTEVFPAGVLSQYQAFDSRDERGTSEVVVKSDPSEKNLTCNEANQTTRHTNRARPR